MMNRQGENPNSKEFFNGTIFNTRKRRKTVAKISQNQIKKAYDDYIAKCGIVTKIDCFDMPIRYNEYHSKNQTRFDKI